MATYQLRNDVHDIDAHACLSESATIVGQTTIKRNAGVWLNITIRGDNEMITIGVGSNVQGGCVLHTDPGFPLVIDNHVTIGHQAMLHGCMIREGALIGIQAVILNNAKIGNNCFAGAGALATEDKDFPDDSLIIDSPAKAVRTLTEEDMARMHSNIAKYVERGQHFKTSLKKIG